MGEVWPTTLSGTAANQKTVIDHWRHWQDMVPVESDEKSQKHLINTTAICKMVDHSEIFVRKALFCYN
jgi:hypothetical protein